jgi:hypothetical protein
MPYDPAADIVADTVTVYSGEAETADVDISYIGEGEISSVRLTIDSALPITSVTSDYSIEYNEDEKCVIVWEEDGESFGNGVLMTVHLDLNADPALKAGEYDINLVIEDVTDADGETIAGCYYHGIQQGVTEFDMYGTIPEGAVSFGFFINQGSMDFNVFSVNVDSDYELPFVNKRIDNAQFRLQNGYLSMFDLQPKYLTYDLPSRNISVNGAETTARGMSRKAKQTVTFPADAISLDTNVLVKTLVGFGEINSLSLNLSSRTIKATLNYENDVQ